ncbi:MAG: hypothetical protein ACI814_003502 [Mariniblastus sp.]|jgi:hypothetical protein
MKQVAMTCCHEFNDALTSPDNTKNIEVDDRLLDIQPEMHADVVAIAPSTIAIADRRPQTICVYLRPSAVHSYLACPLNDSQCT